MGELRELVNIGPEVERQLNLVGIDSEEKLREIGARGAWVKIKEIDPSACINRLMALEGAIRKIRWHDLPEDEKRKLKEFYEENK